MRCRTRHPREAGQAGPTDTTGFPWDLAAPPGPIFAYGHGDRGRPER